MPTREMLLRYEMSSMVTKLIGMYGFNMYQQVNGQDADRQKQLWFVPKEYLPC